MGIGTLLPPAVKCVARTRCRCQHAQQNQCQATYSLLMVLIIRFHSLRGRDEFDTINRCRYTDLVRALHARQYGADDYVNHFTAVE